MAASRHKPLPPRKVFLQRIAKSTILSGSIMMMALGIGILGYHFIAEQAWIDSLLNASMILSGMGPIGDIKNDPGKVFASGYALFSGVVFITTAGILLAPLVHRFLHRFHIEISNQGDE